VCVQGFLRKISTERYGGHVAIVIQPTPAIVNANPTHPRNERTNHFESRMMDQQVGNSLEEQNTSGPLLLQRSALHLPAVSTKPLSSSWLPTVRIADACPFDELHVRYRKEPKALRIRY
jgi:hypothetical protein